MSVRILTGDCRTVLETLPAASVHCCVTSPPYFGLRDYGVDEQIGLEETPDAYVAELVTVFGEVRRALRDDGVVFLNLGDSYAANGSPGLNVSTPSATFHGGRKDAHERRPKIVPVGLKPKDLIGIPWRVAFALQADGWWLRSDIIWSKPNPMPESVTDRPTSAHEHVFLLAKRQTYYFDADAVREPAQDRPQPSPEDKTVCPYRGPNINNAYAPGASGYGHNPLGRNIRNVWTIPTQPYPDAHFATFPPALVEPCIKAGSGDCCCPICGTAAATGRRPDCDCAGTLPPAACTVLDPFGGAGTVGLVADRLKRNAVLIELNPAYADMARQRIAQDAGMFGEVA